MCSLLEEPDRVLSKKDVQLDVFFKSDDSNIALSRDMRDIYLSHKEDEDEYGTVEDQRSEELQILQERMKKMARLAGKDDVIAEHVLNNESEGELADIINTWHHAAEVNVLEEPGGKRAGNVRPKITRRYSKLAEYDAAFYKYTKDGSGAMVEELHTKCAGSPILSHGLELMDLPGEFTFLTQNIGLTD